METETLLNVSVFAAICLNVLIVFVPATALIFMFHDAVTRAGPQTSTTRNWYRALRNRLLIEVITLGILAVCFLITLAWGFGWIEHPLGALLFSATSNVAVFLAQTLKICDALCGLNI